MKKIKEKSEILIPSNVTDSLLWYTEVVLSLEYV